MKKYITIISLLVLGLCSFGQSITYQYDFLGRLTQVTYPNGAIVAYTYDANGNRASYTVLPSTTFPVELFAFSGRTEGEVNVLDWITVSERRSDHYVVERSVDGLIFDNIGKVNASGVSTQKQQYSFTDEKPFQGSNYYRLKIVDQDGFFEYSYVIELTFEHDLPLIIFPNPTKGDVSVHWFGEGPEQLLLEVFSISGISIFKETWTHKVGSIHKVDLGQLPTATYIYRVTMRAKLYTGKIVIK